MNTASFLAWLPPEGTDFEVEAELSEVGRASGMNRVVATKRLKLWASDQLAALDIEGGIVFGAIYRRNGRRVRDFTLLDRHAIAGSRGQSLLDQYWGSYVAIWDDPDGIRIHGLRAPCGRLACYQVAYRGGLLLSNDARLLTRTRALVGDVDWAVLATQLLYEHYRPMQTSLVDLSELIGGMRITWSNGICASTLLWSPWEFAERRRAFTDSEIAQVVVRETTVGCIAAIAEDFDRALLGVSGGLDSSIVASCLASTATQLQCFTLVGPDVDGDERLYARMLCDHLGLRLVELFEDPRLVDLTRSDAEHLPRPVARAFAQSGDGLQHHLADASNVQAFFTGAGGDNVFAYIPSVSPVADRLLMEGVGRHVLTSASDIGLITDTAIPRVVIGAAKRAWFRRPHYHWPADRACLTAQAISMAIDPIDHPWLQAPRGALPGKAAHIAWLLGIENHLEGFRREHTRPLISPLMSQPLVETCLAIPTWAWCENGQNRSVARQAFADVLPGAILARRSKGSPDGFSVQVFEHNRRTIEEMIIDGQLIAQGIVDRVAVLALLRRPALSSPEYARILAFIDIEAWLSAWRRGGRSA